MLKGVTGRMLHPFLAGVKVAQLRWSLGAGLVWLRAIIAPLLNPIAESQVDL